MTKAEKIGIFFSAAALIISITSPVVTYLWLDPKVKEFNDRAQLQVSRAFLMDTEENEFKDSDGKITKYHKGYVQIKLSNIGYLPAKDVQIVCQYNHNITNENFITLDPPSQYEVHNQGNQIFITLKRAIPSRDFQTITFDNFPKVLTVSTESGETNTIDTDPNLSPQEVEELRERLREAMDSLRKAKALDSN